MNTIKRWLTIILAFLLFITATFLVTRNFHPVSIDIISAKIELPLIFIIFIAFFCGALFAFLLNAWVLLVQKRRINLLNQELADYKQEISQLRQSPMNGLP